MSPPRRTLLAALLGMALWGASAGVLERLPARAGEPAVLRWLRKLAEHPVRSPLALTLALVALAPGRSRTRRPGDPAPGSSPRPRAARMGPSGSYEPSGPLLGEP